MSAAASTRWNTWNTAGSRTTDSLCDRLRLGELAANEKFGIRCSRSTGTTGRQCGRLFLAIEQLSRPGKHAVPQFNTLLFCKRL